jgi:hypothetical protein
VGGPSSVQLTAPQRDELFKKITSIEAMGEWTKPYRELDKLKNIYIAEADDVLKFAGSRYQQSRMINPTPNFPSGREARNQQGVQDFIPEVMKTQLRNAGLPSAK